MAPDDGILEEVLRDLRLLVNEENDILIDTSLANGQLNLRRSILTQQNPQYLQT